MYDQAKFSVLMKRINIAIHDLGRAGGISSLECLAEHRELEQQCDEAEVFLQTAFYRATSGGASIQWRFEFALGAVVYLLEQDAFRPNPVLRVALEAVVRPPYSDMRLLLQCKERYMSSMQPPQRPDLFVTIPSTPAFDAVRLPLEAIQCPQSRKPDSAAAQGGIQPSSFKLPPAQMLENGAPFAFGVNSFFFQSPAVKRADDGLPVFDFSAQLSGPAATGSSSAPAALGIDPKWITDPIPYITPSTSPERSGTTGRRKRGLGEREMDIREPSRKRLSLERPQPGGFGTAL